MTAEPTIHASAVLVGGQAVLIRGPSGAGKSRLAFSLILAGRAGWLPPVTLIGDDRIRLSRDGTRLLAQVPPELAGLIEIRGLGIRRCPFAEQGPVGLVVDLAAPDAARLPSTGARNAKIAGLTLPRIPVEAGIDPLHMVVAALSTADATEAPATKKALAEGDL